MRTSYIVLLLVLLIAVGIFAAENTDSMTLKYFNQSITSPRWVMIAIVYLVGTVSGFVVFGLVRRSIRQKTINPPL